MQKKKKGTWVMLGGKGGWSSSTIRYIADIDGSSWWGGFPKWKGFLVCVFFKKKNSKLKIKIPVINSIIVQPRDQISLELVNWKLINERIN